MGVQRMEVFLTELCKRAAEKLVGTSPYLKVLQWEVVVAKGLLRHPIWEIHIEISGPDGVFEFKPVCTFYGKPKNLDNEVDLMVWCWTNRYVMKVQTQL